MTHSYIDSSDKDLDLLEGIFFGDNSVNNKREYYRYGGSANPDLCKHIDILLKQKDKININELKEIYNKLDEKDKKYFDCLITIFNDSFSSKVKSIAKFFYMIILQKLKNICLISGGIPRELVISNGKEEQIYNYLQNEIKINKLCFNFC